MPTPSPLQQAPLHENFNGTIVKHLGLQLHQPGGLPAMVKTAVLMNKLDGPLQQYLQLIGRFTDHTLQRDQ